jgi:hypothetical protein
MSNIHEAILALDLAKVKETLATSPEAANERNQTEETPLMVLSSDRIHSYNYYEKLNKLCKLELAVHDTPEQVVRNKTLLIIENMAKAFVTTPNVDLNATRPNSGKTALHIAAATNNEDLINVLIDAKADLNVQDTDGKTALMEETTFAIRRALAYAGADLAIQDKYENNVLHHILSKHIPDTPSSSLIARMAPELLHVKNNVGSTPQEVAEKQAGKVSAAAAAAIAADALRPKREWEESFEGAAASASGTMDEMVNAVCPLPRASEAVLVKQKTCWSKFLATFMMYFCCCVRRQAVSSPLPEGPKPKAVPTPAQAPEWLALNANTLIYGSSEKPAGRYVKPVDVLLRSDPVKGEFVAHAGPLLSIDDLDDDSQPAPAEAPASLLPKDEVPFHRQTNFTSEDEVPLAAPPQPSQIEKDMDEVFAILGSAAPKPAPPSE